MGQFKLQCRIGNCGAMCSFAVRDFLDNAIKWTFPFANAQKHLLVCPGRPMLLVEDFEKDIAGVKKRKSELLQQGGGGGGGGGGGAGGGGFTPQQAIDDHLSYLNLSKAHITEAYVVAAACDGQSLSSASRFGASFLGRVLRLPPQNDSTLRRAFQNMYSEWVRAPLEAAAAAATAAVSIVVQGGFEYSLQKKLRCSSDGWGRRGVVFESVIATLVML